MLLPEISKFWHLLQQEHLDEQCIEKLERCCVEIEEYWETDHHEDHQELNETIQQDLDSRLEDTLIRARPLLLHCLSGLPVGDWNFIEEHVTDFSQLFDTATSTVYPDSVCVILRTCKNLLRWYLQFYIQLVGDTKRKDLIIDWKTFDMLTVYIHLMRANCGSNPALAQHCSQLLFYASFNPITGSDTVLEKAYDSLFENNLLNTLLECLVGAQGDILLTLSVVRNYHNILVSFPKVLKPASGVSMERLSQEKQGWLQAIESPISLKTALPHIALWAIQQQKQDLPEHDRRHELAAEVMRTCYVMRLGEDMTPSITDPMSKVVLLLLQLDPTHDNERWNECRRASIPILMDADDKIARFLVAEDGLKPLMRILDEIVTEVVDGNLISDSAAAKLTPILSVLLKFSSTNADFLRGTLTHIFPPDEEQEFQTKLHEELANNRLPRNMQPLLPATPDCPRGRLLKLMTWPHGHIKRFTGELLWLLSDRNPQHFVGRVGIGNGITLLNAKGFGTIPDSS